MTYSISGTNYLPKIYFSFGQTALVFIFVLLACVCIFAQTDITSSPSSDQKTITINDAPEMEVYAFGKNVIIEKEAKGVLVFGGDVTIKGKVSGDVAAIGGSIIQTKEGFIGGDVIIFGGNYRPESVAPLRNQGKETVLVAMFEDEIRDFTQNPAQIFAPSLTWRFFAQRLLSILFWFILSMALTTIAPGAVSRSVARFQLSSLKIVGIGVGGFILTTICIVGFLSVFPNYVNAIVIPMALVLLMLSYVYGRVALQVSVGKKLQKKFLSDGNQSETLAILFGVIVWTILLSLPYLWIICLLVLFSISIGLVLTARSEIKWSKSK